jgi:hypothetical protein
MTTTGSAGGHGDSTTAPAPEGAEQRPAPLVP